LRRPGLGLESRDVLDFAGEKLSIAAKTQQSISDD